MNIIESLNWRYATKLFDKTKKVSKEDLDEILESFRLTSSSFGLQPWKLLVIENQSIKDSLVTYSWNQSQISDCSHLLVLCRNNDVGFEYIEKYIEEISKVRGIDRQNLNGFETTIKGFIRNIESESKKNWANNQVFIALGNLLTVLSLKKIDSCAIGGFDSTKYDEILNLSDKSLSSVVVLPIGYRSDDDKYSKLKKVRFCMEEVVEII